MYNINGWFEFLADTVSICRGSWAQVRELEEEVEALQAGRAHRAKLMALMEKKALVGDLFNQLRLARAPPAHLQPDGSLDSCSLL